MYAKLVFPSGTDYNLVARDIVRAIVTSDGAGGSTVGALENVDAGQSTIEDTVAANWTLVSPASLPTGTPVASDMTMVLSQPHANGTIKHVGIGCFRANSLADAGTSKYGGTCMWPYTDYGTADEQAWFRASDVSALSTTVSHSNRFTGEEVHIIAKDKFLGIFGYHSNSYPGWGGILAMEPVDTYETRHNGGAKPTQAFMWTANTKSATFSGHNGSNVNSMLKDYTSTNPFSYYYGQLSQLALMDCVRLPRSGNYYKCLLINGNGWTVDPAGKPGSSDASQRYNFGGAFPDGTYQYNNVGDIESACFGWGIYSHSYGMNNTQFDLRTSKANTIMNAADLRDLSGNKVMQLHPMYSALGEDGYLQDYASEIGVYYSTNLVDQPVQILNDGTDDYLCFSTGVAGIAGPCLWVKVS